MLWIKYWVMIWKSLSFRLIQILKTCQLSQNLCCTSFQINASKSWFCWSTEWEIASFLFFSSLLSCRLSSISLVEFNSSLLLGLTMTLYTDDSYSSSYQDTVDLGFEDTLFFQLVLQTNSCFACDVLLQVESCWATETPDPQDPIQALLLDEGYFRHVTLKYLLVCW